MPVPSKHFYTQPEDDTESDTSEMRWPSCRFVSDVEVPPSDISEPLSAPSSGFSLPKSFDQYPGFKPLVKKQPATRFAKSVVVQQDRWKNFCPSAQEVLASVHNSKKESAVTLQNASLGPVVQARDKFAAWVDTIQGIFLSVLLMFNIQTSFFFFYWLGGFYFINSRALARNCGAC